MLEPVRIPSPIHQSTTTTTTTMATSYTVGGISSAGAMPNDSRNNNSRGLAQANSEDWSDREGKDELGSPTDTKHYENGDSTSVNSKPVKATEKVSGPRAWLGLKPEIDMPEELDHAEHNHFFWSKVKLAMKEPFAEFWGTFILVLFGDAAIAQTLLTANTSAPGADGFGSWVTISWGWGIGLMLGIYVAGDSGAFLNPAICLASCMFRKMPWRRLPMYWLSEFLGAFVAAGVVYANYINGIDKFESGARTIAPSKTATAGIFATYPDPDLTKTSQFFDQFIGSALLVFIIFALKDDSNKGKFIASGAWFPLGLFFTMTGIAISFGWQTGFAINPARDFGPRLMTACIGYGSGVWSAGGYYFWVPIVSPFCGAVTGAFLYDAFVYTGETPVNTPWFGLKQFLKPHRVIQNRIERQEAEGMV